MVRGRGLLLVCGFVIFVASVLAEPGAAPTAGATVTAGSTDASRPASAETPRQPIAVRVTEAPEDPTAKNLAYATWGLVVVTAVLCFATLWIGRKQSQDARLSISISREAADAARRSADAAASAAEAAARDRAAEQLRELHLSAHRVAVKATRVQKIALSVPREMRELGSHLRMDGPNSRVDLADQKVNERHARAAAIATEALMRIPDASAPPSDKDADDRLRQLDAWMIELEAMGEEAEDELRGIREQILFVRQRDAQLLAARIGAQKQT